MKKAHQRIDVNVFREILSGKYNPTAEKGTSKKKLLELVQEISQVKIKIKGKSINRNKLIDQINFREFGYRNREDVKITFKETVFEETEMILQTKVIYDLEEGIELPTTISLKQKQYHAILSDIFERLKIKCDNVLNDTDEHQQIALYASKNIQAITRIFYEAKTMLKKSKKQKSNKDRFNIYVQTLFISNCILYLQNMFSSYYHEKSYTKNNLKLEMYDSIGPELFSEPTAEYRNYKETNNTNKIRLKDNSNVIITLYYDMMKHGLIENNPKLVEDRIHNTYVSKNGTPISRSTIYTALKNYRPEKRAKGDKRIDITKYVNME
jgi:hypothetical protein